MRDFFADLGRFLWAVVRVWKATVTGSIAIALLFVASAYGVRVPITALRVIVVGSFLYAFFHVWRDESQARKTAEVEASRVRGLAQSEDFLAPQLPANQLWLLAVVARYGLKRLFLRRTESWIGNRGMYALGDEPVHPVKSEWFHNLANDVYNRGLIKPDRNIYRLEKEGERALAAARRKGNVPAQPDELIHALTDAPLRFPLD